MADNTKKKENNKPKKSFFKDVRAELKKVTWPTRKQVVNNTVGVIIIVIITAIIVFVLDFTFKNFNEYVVNGVRKEVSRMAENNTDNTVSGENEENNNTTTDDNSADNTNTGENNVTDNTTSDDTNTGNEPVEDNTVE